MKDIRSIISCDEYLYIWRGFSERPEVFHDPEGLVFDAISNGMQLRELGTRFIVENIPMLEMELFDTAHEAALAFQTEREMA